MLTECFYKLHARNRTEAVAKAVKHGLTQFALIASVLSGIGTDAQEQLRTRIQHRPTIRTIRIRNNREGIV
ncbi:hypothetical protein P3339_18830 [Microbulbifer sp. MLAF003]|uniref:hypothetical protein n=1 Tax=unclassified Microbulbifer TaxID=2619833 RepID=UPI0024AE2FD0|nr:hypothetical protein [Microbulbifer sp. MLAF003]WHI50472.1 hypothetical protein P3339_18830 [Microbulbifer sp. MLAF003]